MNTWSKFSKNYAMISEPLSFQSHFSDVIMQWYRVFGLIKELTFNFSDFRSLKNDGLDIRFHFYLQVFRYCINEFNKYQKFSNSWTVLSAYYIKWCETVRAASLKCALVKVGRNIDLFPSCWRREQREVACIWINEINEPLSTLFVHVLPKGDTSQRRFGRTRNASGTRVALNIYLCLPLRVTDSKYRESLDRFEKSKTLKLCLKNAFREFSSKILFRFSKNPTSSRNSQITKIHLFTSLNMQKISGKLTKFSVFALKQFTILEHRINLAQKFHLSSI